MVVLLPTAVACPPPFFSKPEADQSIMFDWDRQDNAEGPFSKKDVQLDAELWQHRDEPKKHDTLFKTHNALDFYFISWQIQKDW